MKCHSCPGDLPPYALCLCPLCQGIFRTRQKLLGSGLSSQICLCFQGFRDSKFLNGCLEVWASNEQVTYVCEECNNYQDLQSIFMISDYKIFSIMLLRELNLGVCCFNSYFTFITKGKLHFSLIYRFYCCLVKEGWALEIAYQFVIRELVAYKPVAYKKIVKWSSWFLLLYFTYLLPLTYGFITIRRYHRSKSPRST